MCVADTQALPQKGLTDEHRSRKARQTCRTFPKSMVVTYPIKGFTSAWCHDAVKGHAVFQQGISNAATVSWLRCMSGNAATADASV